MSSSTSHSYSIEKFNINWQAWKLKSKAVLIGDDLWKVTDPSTSYTNAALGPKSYSKITLLIDSDQLVYINAMKIRGRTGGLYKKSMNKASFPNRSRTFLTSFVQPMNLPAAPPCSPTSTVFLPFMIDFKAPVFS